MTEPTTDLRLAQLVCARMCHDLGGPVGTVDGALGLLPSDEEEALSVAREAAEVLRRRLRLYRAAWGAGLGDLGIGEVLDLTEGLLSGGRARVSAEGIEPGHVLPEALAQVLLNALILAGEALPRGGVVRLGAAPDGGFVLLPQGQGAAWPAGLAAAIAAGGLDPSAQVTARGVVAPLLAGLARDAGIRVVLAMGAGPGPAPLSLLPPTT
jgi:histidine phosphotransferase ChpT